MAENKDSRKKPSQRPAETKRPLNTASKPGQRKTESVKRTSADKKNTEKTAPKGRTEEARRKTPPKRPAKGPTFIRRIRRFWKAVSQDRQMQLYLGGAVAVLILLILLIVGISKAVSGHREKVKEEEEAKKEEESGVVMEEVDISTVTHLSFSSLIASTELAFAQEELQESGMAATIDQGHLTVNEFMAVLQQLYDQDYILVRLHDLAVVDENSDSEAFSDDKLMLPAGKKPLIISQQDLSYDLDYYGVGLADKLVLDENGSITSQRTRLDGSVETGDLDLVTCLNAFIEEHPDFPYNGARGVLGFTGYNGILGYRTTDYLAAEEDNKYVGRFGLFDVESEKAEAAAVLEVLRQQGWEFACNGYDKVSYTDINTVTQDVEAWKNSTGSLLGDVDILLFPSGYDIGGKNTYDQDNEIYAYLEEQGFRYFCAMDISGSFTQKTASYLRCNYQNLDGYRMYQDLTQDTARFSGILDFTDIYDQTRPSWQNDFSFS